MKRFYILLVFITLGMMANAQSFQVKVVKISDGDIIEVSFITWQQLFMMERF